MNDPAITSDGESWTYSWEEYGVSINFAQLRERSDGLHGELWVTRDEHLNGASPHISWGMFNLSSPTTRSRQAGLLANKAGYVKVAYWSEMLEYACTYTAADFRKGEPGANLADGEPELEPSFLVKPLLPVGQPTILFADGESSKGWVALGLAIALRLGGEVIPGLVPTKQCNTVYLDWEDDENNVRRRHRYICRGLGIHALPDLYYRRLYRPLADELSGVREFIRRTHSEFVIIDSIGLAAAGDIKESDPAMRFMGAVRHLDTTSLLLGHVSKAAAAQKAEAARVIGSTFYQLLARSAWEMKADPESQPVVVGFYHRKSNIGPRQPSFALRLNFEDAPHYRLRFERCGLDASPVVADKLPLSQRMMAALRHRKMSTSELAEILDVSPAALRKSGERLAREGSIVRLASEGGKQGRGREQVWGLAAFPAGREA